jgi:hypothetical protein
MPTKRPGISAISIIPSCVDGGFDYTQKNGVTPSLVRKWGVAHSGMPSSVIGKPQNHSRPQREYADEEARDKCNFHDILLR